MTNGASHSNPAPARANMPSAASGSTGSDPEQRKQDKDRERPGASATQRPFFRSRCTKHFLARRASDRALWARSTSLIGVLSPAPSGAFLAPSTIAVTRISRKSANRFKLYLKLVTRPPVRPLATSEGPQTLSLPSFRRRQKC